MAENQKVTWTAIGRRLERAEDAQQPIPVTEINRSVSMGDGDFPYGIAVDAPLAVQLIRNLWEGLRREVPDEKAWIRRMFDYSKAITLDKNVLLKILSQPRSEGIRFYPCVKKASDGTDVLSLVAVAVDAEGTDLLYKYDPAVHKQGIAGVPTTSLIAEYGHPPGAVEEQPAAGIDPFVLFRYSENI